MSKKALVGRPEVTSHAAIELAAFELFNKYGFEATTLEAIAQKVGVGRRTLFRYYRSKNDIPWGQFDRTLDEFRKLLDATPVDVPLLESVGRGVVEFNRFLPEASPSHLERMRLILETPALQAHSGLRYAEWRDVIAKYVAKRLSLDAGEMEPQLIGHLALAVALTAYERWLQDPEVALTQLIEQGMGLLVERASEVRAIA